MTGKPRDFGAILKARRALISKKIAELKQQRVELHGSRIAEDERELREIEQLQAEVAEFEQALDKALNWPKEKRLGGTIALTKRPERFATESLQMHDDPQNGKGGTAMNSFLGFGPLWSVINATWRRLSAH